MIWLVTGHTRTNPDLPLYECRLSTRVGRHPACSWPGLRIEREPDAVARVRCENGHLAGFLALRRAPIGLAMAILHGNSRHQLIERVFAAIGAEPDTAVFAHCERQAVAFLQSCLFHNLAGNNPHREAPLRDLRFDIEGSTLNIHRASHPELPARRQADTAIFALGHPAA